LRGLLAAGCGSALAAAGVDLDYLRWEPGQRTHFLPPARSDLGISIRFLRQYQVTDVVSSRLDVLYGVGIVRPEMAVRIASDDGWSSSESLKVGDVFTIKGQHAPNPAPASDLTFHKDAFSLVWPKAERT
jgi:hypothetical protein